MIKNFKNKNLLTKNISLNIFIYRILTCIAFIFMTLKVHSQKINESYKIHPKKTDQIINIDGVTKTRIEHLTGKLPAFTKYHLHV